MMFLNSLTDWLRNRFSSQKASTRPTYRLRLEPLEDRLVPANFATYTNASVQITPGFTVTEQVTATVTDFPSFNFNFATGAVTFTPPPAGSPNPTGGTVLFNLNNLMQTATLNSNGQATATFQVPLLAFLTSQTLAVQFEGFFPTGGPNTWDGSSFVAPLYKNFDNLLLPGTLTFNQLTPAQVYAQQISSDTNFFNNPTGNTSATVSNPFNTANGETDTLAGGLLAFNYVDPGTIQSVTAFGILFPASVAFQLGAYKGLQ